MIKLRIIYTDGRFMLKNFPTVEDAMWFVHAEGDHVLEYEVLL